MTYTLNQIFIGTYPPEAAQFCNTNGYVIKEIAQQNGKKRFQIQEIAAPTAEELAEQRRQEIFSELDRIDRASSRALRAVLVAQSAGQEPDAADVERLAGYEASAKALRAELAGLEA